MIKSIQQFQAEGVKNLEKIFDIYSNDLSKVAEMVEGVTTNVVSLGLSMIAEEWEFYDELIRKRRDLRPDWHVVKKDEVTKITSLGAVRYHKTLFLNKKTGERSYLLDRIIGFDSHERLTEDAVARILDEAADSSYRKGGLHASISGESVSKEAVMNKIRPLKFPPVKAEEEKRKVKTLYIDADEEHVALQYLEKKGDIKDKRSNTYMPKLVYVYEGMDVEEDRHELINVKYFGGGYDGRDGSAHLWKEVYDYIEAAYDEETLERIYVNGDGAEWIKTGAKTHKKAKFVLDKYHMHKYIIAATSHLMDSAQDAREEIHRAIRRQSKKEAEATFNKILSVTESESKSRAVEASKRYILGQWPGIMQGVRNRKDKIRCSAEGHISHIYADRMSSRPLGWSAAGADKMARLRIYKKNGGSMLELARYQKEEQAVGAEEVIYSCEEMLRMEAKNRQRLGDMADMPIYSIPYTNIKKIMQFKAGIQGL